MFTQTLNVHHPINPTPVGGNPAYLDKIPNASTRKRRIDHTAACGCSICESEKRHGRWEVSSSNTRERIQQKSGTNEPSAKRNIETVLENLARFNGNPNHAVPKSPGCGSTPRRGPGNDGKRSMNRSIHDTPCKPRPQSGLPIHPLIYPSIDAPIDPLIHTLPPQRVRARESGCRKGRSWNRRPEFSWRGSRTPAPSYGNKRN